MTMSAIQVVVYWQMGEEAQSLLETILTRAALLSSTSTTESEWFTRGLMTRIALKKAGRHHDVREDRAGLGKLVWDMSPSAAPFTIGLYVNLNQSPIRILLCLQLNVGTSNHQVN
jgi:hypothetical protein